MAEKEISKAKRIRAEGFLRGKNLGITYGEKKFLVSFNGEEKGEILTKTGEIYICSEREAEQLEGAGVSFDRLMEIRSIKGIEKLKNLFDLLALTGFFSSLTILLIFLNSQFPLVTDFFVVTLLSGFTILLIFWMIWFPKICLKFFPNFSRYLKGKVINI